MSNSRETLNHTKNSKRHVADGIRTSEATARSESDILCSMATATRTTQAGTPGCGRAERSTGKAPFESWGRYPTYGAKILPLHWQSDFPAITAGLHNGALPVGMGRSYGDVCLLKDGNLLSDYGHGSADRLRSGDRVAYCRERRPLAQILDFAVPRGFFLPVTPGTKYVTLGGAIANDIHGKNHHVAGTFGRHITQFELVRSDGSREALFSNGKPGALCRDDRGPWTDRPYHLGDPSVEAHRFAEDRL